MRAHLLHHRRRGGASWGFGLTIAVGALVAVACASTEDGDGTSSSSSSSSSSGVLPGGGTDGGGVADEFKGCATDQKKASTLPLDLYVMFDTSGSMATLVAPNKTKYQAATEALIEFAKDQGSAGIGMGLQFFPLPPAGVPQSCTSSADCPGNSGPCSVKVCQNGAIKYCNNAGDCGANGPCVTAETCSLQTNTYCSPAGDPCGNDAKSGFDQGDCATVTKGYCTGGDSCVAADYATPAVPIGTLPGSVAAIQSALAAKSVQSATPTSAALQGAVTAASNYAQANAGHVVVVVFLTDGLPQGCDENIDNISNIAATGRNGTPSIKTFVIGVFGDAEKAAAQANLDKIADKGGSSKAFIVGANTQTTADFLKAMNTVRGSALPCEYNIPQPASGTPDYEQLNIQRTDPGGKKSVFGYVKSESGCGNGGWYYDTDPAAGKPTKIILCPSTCTDVKSGGGQVDVVIGCKTVVK